jgi:hypothetical protein
VNSLGVYSTRTSSCTSTECTPGKCDFSGPQVRVPGPQNQEEKGKDSGLPGPLERTKSDAFLSFVHEFTDLSTYTLKQAPVAREVTSLSIVALAIVAANC